MQHLIRLIYLSFFVVLSWAIVLLLPPSDVHTREQDSFSPNRWVYDSDTDVLYQSFESERREDPALEHREDSAPKLERRDPAPAPRETSTSRNYRIVRMHVRAYTPWDDIDRDSPYRDGKTSINKDTRIFPNQWGIAACPRMFPRGTRIIVPGYKPSRHFPENHAWPVDDTGGIIRQWNRRFSMGRERYPLIEVRFIHQRSAFRWGNKILDVKVFDPE